MHEATEQRKKRKKILIIILILLIAVIIALLWKTGVMHREKCSDAIQEQTQVVQETADTTADSASDTSDIEYQSIQNEEAQSHNDPSYKSEKTVTVSQEKATTRSGATASSNTSAREHPSSLPETNETEIFATATNSDALTLVLYDKDWIQPSAMIALKNNTAHTVTFVSGRILYYDMNDNILDSMDFTKSITIEPDKVRRFIIDGFRAYEEYAYYKNKTSPSHPDRKYKVKFKLKSYKTN
ncbi:MAG: hypothetical protein J5701_02130 [Bacteroidales bacterium]|nr:hypothetical protein [Bacteroidales bacterium]